MGQLIGMLVAVVALLLGLIMVSFVSQGRMARATADIARGLPTSLSSAWGSGVDLFWRYVGLWLVLAGVAIGVAAVVGALLARYWRASSPEPL